ncbi:hypothetical protein K443DRAFT_12661 [Laccaria amethystina LaAM-08-1]|uniref:Uncharacterized protein n=1 Tax=Laccaria amethystina LaAM-08-1 TaxID=1095629 RepID=A0A0C9WIY1_9AGAR|nr:hypothetical protein K443DRAFT_12661 [Laccaria amethystina LaAM-08-1]
MACMIEGGTPFLVRDVAPPALRDWPAVSKLKKHPNAAHLHHPSINGDDGPARYPTNGDDGPAPAPANGHNSPAPHPTNGKHGALHPPPPTTGTAR